jgi:hypothetical protein
MQETMYESLIRSLVLRCLLFSLAISLPGSSGSAPIVGAMRLICMWWTPLLARAGYPTSTASLQSNCVILRVLLMLLRPLGFCRTLL